ncbi:unnamed protein product [Phyllotreta striolata]|uniref:Galactose mutarotase n=1 Tax=Phyllotreta striolata TaxID=444603 RepID=A0A9N9TUU4_PHYSR|nr:unnamed protein product [Phyllotreta striolata]
MNMDLQEVESSVNLTEEFFGYYYDEAGNSHKIKRFTWKNENKIQVKVINYGARVTSICFPDRNGVVDDIVLGFDDLAGYIFYSKYYFGATIGRMTNLVQNSKIFINRKQSTVKSNMPGNHQKNGGQFGFDQKVWDSHIEGKKVVMTYVSPNGEEGYPGNLMTQITFELSERNEFKINIEAMCSRPTVVNLSNLTYFNLAGHHAGPDQIYKHILTLNCNCFTVQDENGFSTGEIQNVVHTTNDFQIPKTLGTVIGITAKDGFNQNFCVNKGVNQDECFVARVLHPPSGRLIELYSNQYGVQLDTGNLFGYGLVQSVEELLMNADAEKNRGATSDRSSYSKRNHTERSSMSEKSESSGKTDRSELQSNRRNVSMKSGKSGASSGTEPSEPSQHLSGQEDEKSIGTKKSIVTEKSLGGTEKSLAETEKSLEAEKSEETHFDSVLKLVDGMYGKLEESLKKDKETEFTEIREIINMLRNSTNKIELVTDDLPVDILCDDFEALSKICFSSKLFDYLKLMKNSLDEQEDEEDTTAWLKKIVDSIIQYCENLKKEPNEFLNDNAPFEKHPVPPTPPPSINVAASSRKKANANNKVPSYYQNSDRIIGKGHRLYTMHGGIALQSQNYPNCANIPHFPNCTLKPGEKYRHTITYKFWIRTGNPSRWIKRNQHEMALMQKANAR